MILCVKLVMVKTERSGGQTLVVVIFKRQSAQQRMVIRSGDGEKMTRAMAPGFFFGSCVDSRLYTEIPSSRR